MFSYHGCKDNGGRGGGWLTTSGKNGENVLINKTQFELNIVKFIFPFLMIHISNTHASKNFKADYQVKNRKQI